jgi:hypothetical protein
MHILLEQGAVGFGPPLLTGPFSSAGPPKQRLHPSNNFFDTVFKARLEINFQ